MAQNVLQVYNLPVTCPLHLQRRNEICSATFSLWGKLGAPGHFLAGAQGQKERRPHNPAHLSAHLSHPLPPPRNLLRVARKPHISLHHNHICCGPPHLPAPLPPDYAVGYVLREISPQPPTAQSMAQPAHEHPKTLPPSAQGSCCLNHREAGTFPLPSQPWAPRQHHPSTQELQTHPCWVTGIHHSQSSASSRCSGHRGGDCPPGYSTSHTVSAPGLEAKRRVRG